MVPLRVVYAFLIQKYLLLAIGSLLLVGYDSLVNETTGNFFLLNPGGGKGRKASSSCIIIIYSEMIN